MVHDFRNRLSRVSLVQITVDIIQESYLFNSQNSCRIEQLALADFPQLGQPWKILLLAAPAPFAARGRHQADLHPLRRIIRQREPRSKRFIIRVGKDAHQLQRFSQEYLLMILQCHRRKQDNCDYVSQ